jgi:hypothetical protein
MKKITLFLVFLLSCLGYAQVPIGNGTNELQSLPFDPYYGYTYSQSIYYASEINANGNITSLQWYFSGNSGSTIPDSQNITVYLGHTTKTSFSSNTDWESFSGLTAVYTGGVPVNGPGWVTITFTTPFAYNGTDNLLIAVDENMPSFDASTDDFYNTAVSSPRTIFFRSDSVNPDPATPPTTGTLLSTVSFVPNVILQGIAPPCVAPNNLVASTVMSNSVTLTWNDPSGTQTDYEYVIQSVGTGAPTANGTAVLGSTSVTDNTVQPNTSYEVYVRANCGTDGYSTWYGPITFLTPCVTSIAPWVYDVETAATTTNSSISDCWVSNPTGVTTSFRWDVDGNGSTPTTLTGPSGANSGVKYFYTESSSGALGSVAELYTPMVDVSTLTVPSLQFYYHMYGSTIGELHVDVYNGTSWVNDVDVIIGQQQTADTDPWALKVVNLASYTGTIQVRFRGIRGSGTNGDMALDDISIKEAPSCLPPNNIVVSNITAQSVQLDWDDMSNVSQFDFEYVIQTQGLGTPTANGTSVSDVTVVNSTLLSNTLYEVYVRADCGTEYSTWVGPVNFKTLCDPFTVPYTENFDAYLAGTSSNPITPDCWFNIDSGLGYGYVSSTYSNSAPRSYYLYNSSDDTGDYMLVSPQTTALSSGLNRTRFFARSGSAGYSVEVGTMSNPNDPTTFTLITSITLTNALTEYTVYIPTGTDLHLAFRHGLGGTYRSVYLDDIVVEAIPSCVEPAAFEYTSLGNTSVGLSWIDPSGVQSNYEYVIQAPGTGEPTTNGLPATGTSVTDNTLTANTAYEAYIRANCGGGDYSVWVGPITFTTLCNAFTVPYSENFDTYSTGSTTNNNTPDCWTYLESFGGLGYGYIASTTPNSGTRNFYLYNSGDSTGEYLLVSPQTTALSSGLNRTRFFARSTSSLGYTVEVGTMSDVTDPTTFTIISSVTLTSTYTEYTFDIPTGTDTFLAFRHGLGGTYRAIYLDDIVVEAIPSCIEPNTFESSNLSTTSVDLSWGDMSSLSQFDFQYVIQAPGTGEPTTSGIAVSNNNMVTDNTLTANTTYEAYVRADCGGGDFSSWVGPITFTTLCNPFTVPYIENFDSYSTGSTTNNNTPDCWTYIEPAGGLGYGYISSTSPYSGTRNFYLYNSGDSTGDYMLVSPQTTALSNGLNRTRFYARSTSNLGYTVQVGTMSDVTDPTTFTLIGTITLTNSHTEYIQNIPTGTDTFLVFRHGLGGTYRSIYLDDITVEPIPTSPPLCVTNIVATPDALCGNFATAISWDLASGADGYYITMGTTSGANDVLDNVDLGNVTTYSYEGAFNTTYYYTITPYNAFGTASGCTESSFVTATNGCYCQSVPTSNDGNGITNVLLSTLNYANPDVTYADYTTTGTPESLQAGASIPLQVTFETGWTYDTNVWIDFNDDFVFDSTSELVVSGTSTSSNPSILDITFTMPTNANLGNHRMRIGSADSGQATPNPCYSGLYGVTLDFTVNVVPNLSTSTFVNETFKAYPNPVKDIFKIEYDTEISNVKVINLLGQVVIDNSVNATTTEINMSQLNAGTYMVNVTIGEAIKTIKVIKD